MFGQARDQQPVEVRRRQPVDERGEAARARVSHAREPSARATSPRSASS